MYRSRGRFLTLRPTMDTLILSWDSRANQAQKRSMVNVYSKSVPAAPLIVPNEDMASAVPGRHCGNRPFGLDAGSYFFPS
eukprot:6212075-Pleurochrysis_carterae.AAC.3